MHIFEKNWINKNNIIKFFIFFSTILIVLNFYQFVFERSFAQYTDWLINYQGGFVRRGFIGELLFRIYQIFNIPLDVVVFIFVSILYVFFGIFFIKIIESIKLNYLNYFLIFSPLSFFYPVMEQKVSGRKDILFLFAMSFLAIFLEKIKFDKQKYVIIFFITLLTLSHSGFFFYTPFLFLIYLLVNHKTNLKKLSLNLSFIILTTLFLFITTILNSNIDLNAINKICESIGPYINSCAENNYIATLNWTLKYEMSLVDELWNKENYIIFYSIAFLLALLPLIYALTISKFENKNFKKINPILILIILNIITFPIYYIGADYGRYMYISYISILILYFKSLSIKFIKTDKDFFESFKLSFKKQFIIILIFLYGFTWTIPHCCNNSFKFIYAKPIKQLNILLD